MAMASVEAPATDCAIEARQPTKSRLRAEAVAPPATPCMEETDLLCRSVEQVEESAPRLGIREAVPTIQRALVL